VLGVETASADRCRHRNATRRPWAAGENMQAIAAATVGKAEAGTLSCQPPRPARRAHAVTQQNQRASSSAENAPPATRKPD